jgi:hypothetical protein
LVDLPEMSVGQQLGVQFVVVAGSCLVAVAQIDPEQTGSRLVVEAQIDLEQAGSRFVAVAQIDLEQAGSRFVVAGILPVAVAKIDPEQRLWVGHFVEVAELQVAVEFDQVAAEAGRVRRKVVELVGEGIGTRNG